MVTMREVAARAGVSHATVSYILNNKTQGVSISDDTRNRVLRLAEEMGYRVNNGAKVFRSGKFNCAALLLSTKEWSSNLPQCLWDGIHDALAEREYHLTLCKLPDEKLTDDGVVPKVLRELMADGLLIDYTHRIPERMVELIRNHQLPAIWINSRQESDCVYPDDYDAARRATEYLLQLGHTRIAYVDYVHLKHEAGQHYSVPERRDGYEAAMRQAKAKTCFIGDAIVPLKDRLEHIKNYVCSPASPTALLCYSPDDATLAFMACAQCNKQVPRDLSLVSFESKTFYIAGTALAIFKTPDYEVGKEAVSLLFRKMEDSTRKLEPVSVPFTLEAGETCAPPVA